jgi:hypothetical protein
MGPSAPLASAASERSRTFAAPLTGYSQCPVIVPMLAKARDFQMHTTPTGFG